MLIFDFRRSANLKEVLVLVGGASLVRLAMTCTQNAGYLTHLFTLACTYFVQETGTKSPSYMGYTTSSHSNPAAFNYEGRIFGFLHVDVHHSRFIL